MAVIKDYITMICRRRYFRVILFVIITIFCLRQLVVFKRIQTVGLEPLLHLRKESLYDCKRLWDADTAKTAKQEALTYMNKNPRHKISNAQYLELANDCVSFQRQRGYIMDAMTSEEETYPIAYSIVLYKDVEQVERLLRAIYRPQNVYCIHVDLHANETYEVMTKIIRCFPNVFHSPGRFDVKWGELSILMPDLACMAALLKHKTKWRYFINLTGQEFPLKTNAELVQILKAFGGANDLEGKLKRDIHRLLYSVKTKKRKPPPPLSIIPFKGNMHMTASRGFVDFIINDPKSHAFYDWVKDTRFPEETYFATLQHNSHLGAPGGYTGSSPETNYATKPFLSRYMIWQSPILMKKMKKWRSGCHGKFVRQVCVMGVGDLQNLVAAKKLFVNKLYLNYQYLALDCLEEWLFQKTIAEYQTGRILNTTYYKGLEVVRNCNCAR